MTSVFGPAEWIGASHPFDLHEVYLDFRAPVVSGRVNQTVQLYLTADARYRFWLNGELLSRGPERSYPGAQSYDVIALTERWRSGPNQLAIQVYQPGYSHFAYVHRGAAGCLAALYVAEELMLTSDVSWRVRRSPLFDSSVPRVSIYGSGAERQSMGAEDNWLDHTYQDAEWDWARIVAPANGYLWTGLRLRTTPLPKERLLQPALLQCRQGEDDFSEEAPHHALRVGWLASQPVVLGADAQGWFQPRPAAAISSYWLYDLGRAYTCQGVVEVKGASGAESLVISYLDKLAGEEPVLSDPDTYCRVQLTDQFELRSDTQTLASFSLRGGRYLLFRLSGRIGGRLQLRFSARVAEYPIVVSKPLNVADTELQAITQLCENTMRACLQDSFVDCVWREASQWVGDGLVQSYALWAMTDDLRPLRKLLFDAAKGQYEDGLLPSVVPGEVHAYTIPRYSCMWVELLAFYLEKSGDRMLVQGDNDGPWNDVVWRAFLRLMDFFEQAIRRAPDGLCRTPAGRRHYLDWSPTSQNDPHLVYNLHIVLALQKASWLVNELKLDLPHNWPALTTELRDRCHEAFWQDGIWYDDREATTHSQLGAALALLTGAATPAEAGHLLNEISERSLRLDDDHHPGDMVLASPFMHHYLFLALQAAGRAETVVAIIRARWGRWVAAGEPTTWENWNVDFPDGSKCHAFSAHPRYHLAQALAGSPAGWLSGESL